MLPFDTIFHPTWEPVLRAASRLHATNPFSPTWAALVKEAAVHGGEYSAYEAAESLRQGTLDKNLACIAKHLSVALDCGRKELLNGAGATPVQLAWYQGSALFVLWYELVPELQRLVDARLVDAPFHDAFVARHRHYFGFSRPGLSVPEPRHLFALFYQAYRAWRFPAAKIRGASPSAMAARAAIWCASMGADVCVYADGLYRRMDGIPVLITGETGTGKELAAQSIGWSRYIPFDAGARRFARRHDDDFHARNICEVPSELLPSALFGHRRGSFTGATTDATGYFGLPKADGTLFLDEIGELSAPVQAMLLRPLQNREIVLLGDTRPQEVHGRLISATHRDLEALCQAGAFRADLLERLCGMRIHMPPLRQMLAEAPEELGHYVRGFVADEIDNPATVDRWAKLVVESIFAKRSGHPWPRNLRELKHYTEHFILTGGGAPAPPVSVPANLPVVTAAPAPAPPAAEPKPEAAGPASAGVPANPESMALPSSETLGDAAKAGRVTMAEVNRSLVTHTFVETNLNKAETARRLGMDWRKIDRWLDPVRLARLLKKKK